MEKNKEVEIERERIKEIIERKFLRLITLRKDMKNWRSKNSSPLKLIFKLEDDILFLIDNPNYKNLTPEEKEDNKLKAEEETNLDEYGVFRG